ncbi:MAG: adenosylcobinamide-phosphate synthase [Clostridia bacterium]|nr:adenosylcobinamide-phosphate synthase [Clostridia bacterium]
MLELVLAAVALDLLLGDPRNFPHPVVMIGKAIELGERLIRQITKTNTGLKIGGTFLVATIVCSTYFAAYAIILAAQNIHPYFGIAVQVWLLYTTISIKSLHQHAIAVAVPLQKGDMAEARKKLSFIVGRDTDKLDESEVTRGVVETVAENTVDGIISPLFYAFIGGAPLALAYKAVNTLDSMVGYREERYLHLGWAAARFDDVANFLPARLAGIFFVLAAVFTPQGPKKAWKVVLRDAKRHPSPNGGIPEAAVAGGLGIKLGGTNYYFGKPSHRAEIGDKIVSLEVSHIKKVLQLMYLVTFLMLVTGAVVTRVALVL